MARSLTKKQKEILNFIKDFRRKNGISPSQADIGRHFGFSTAAAHAFTNRMLKRGILVKTKHEHNSIGLTPTDERYCLVRNDRKLLVFKSDTLEIPITEFEGYFFKVID